MSIKILTALGVENTNIDAARMYNFSAGGISGILQGALGGGELIKINSYTLALSSCELLISGNRVILDETIYFEYKTPTVVSEKYTILARIEVKDKLNPEFEFATQPTSIPLKQDNIFKDGKGIFELEICKFDYTSSGITNVVKTIKTISNNAYKVALEAIELARRADEQSLEAERQANLANFIAVKAEENAKQSNTKAIHAESLSLQSNANSLNAMIAATKAVVLINNIRSPVTGLLVGLQEALNEMYADFTNGIMAEQFDNLNIAITELNTKNISAYNFDKNSKLILIGEK